MFTNAVNPAKAVVINIEHISTILEWRAFDMPVVTRIYTLGSDEPIDVAEDFNRVIDKVRGEK
jgi:hypothetical protein